MNKVIFILLLFVNSVSFGQSIIFRLPFDNNGADSSGNSFAGGHTGLNSETYSSTVKKEGSHSWIGREYCNWESSSAYNFSDRTFAISVWMLRNELYGGSHMIFTNKENTGSAGFDIRWDEDNQRIYGRTSDGVAPNDFYTTNNTMAFGSWYHLVVNFYSGYVTLYLNGIKQTLADSTILTNWTDNKILALCTGSDGVALNWLGGYMDNVQLYNNPITTAQVDSLYDNGATDFQLGDNLTPVIAGGYFYRENTPKYPYRNGLRVYPVRSGGGISTPVIPIFTSGYDSTYVLAVTQKYAIPEAVENGDQVGYWIKTWTWMGGTNTTKSITQNFNSAFAINPATGLITISDKTKINGKIVQQDTIINLIIRTTCNTTGVSELDTAIIYVKENNYSVFINPQSTGTHNGARATPLLTFPSSGGISTIQPGYGYFVKRGAVFSALCLNVQAHIATLAHPTLIGVYDTGVDPVWDGTGAPSNSQGLYFGDEDNWTSGRCEYIYVFNQDIKDYTVSAIEAYSESRNMGFYNLKIHNNDINSRQSQFTVSTNSYADTLNSDPFEFINCEFDTVGRVTLSEASHVKIGTSPAYFTNCRFGVTRMAQLRLADGSHGSIIKHCLFEPGITTTGDSYNSIQVRQHHTSIIDCRFISGGDAIFMTGPGEAMYMNPDYVTIQNCYFYNQQRISINMRPPGDAANVSVGHVYEDNLIATGGIGIKIRDAQNLIIRRNIIKGMTGATYGIISTEENNLNTQISYNIIYGFGNDEINLSVGVSPLIYNNTVDGSINVSASLSPVIRNNFYISTTVNTSNNIDIDNISTAQYFEDYANHDYRLKSTATQAINTGYSYGSSTDIFGTSVPQGTGTDIGAIERSAEIAEVIIPGAYYMSPTGDDNNPGTLSEPWLTFNKLNNTLSPGDVVYMLGGIYTHTITSGDGYAMTIHGDTTDSILILNYPGQIPILDCSNITSPSYDDVYALYSNLEYVRIRGLQIRNLKQTSYEKSVLTWQIVGDHSVIDNCKVYNTGGRGFFATNSNELTFRNCDAWNHNDSLTASMPGNDGYGFFIQDLESTTRRVYLKNCRAWLCGDDGFTCYSNAYVEFDGCWSFWNGLLEGEGHGYKLGWLEAESSGLRRVVKNCLAVENKSNGITTNDDPGSTPAAVMNIYNNTLYGNTTSSGWGDAYGVVIFNSGSSNDIELGRVFRNNLSYDNTGGDIWVGPGALYTYSHNSWNLAVTVDNSDFASLDGQYLDDARSGSSLPNLHGYLELVTGSDLINAGVNVGLAYLGTAPDLGYMEKQ